MRSSDNLKHLKFCLRVNQKMESHRLTKDQLYQLVKRRDHSQGKSDQSLDPKPNLSSLSRPTLNVAAFKTVKHTPLLSLKNSSKVTQRTGYIENQISKSP